MALGRTAGSKSKHAQEMKKALKDPEASKAQSGRASRMSLENLTTSKGDTNQVVAHIDDPSNPDGLSSFLPASLQCLDKFLPSILLKQSPDTAEKLLGGAPTVAQNVVTELSRMQTDAPDGIHFLAFVGGALVVLGSLLNFVLGIFRLSPLHAYFSFVMVLFGLIILVLEQQRAVFPPHFRAGLERYFLFVTLIAGRGCFYVYVGMVQAAIAWKRSPVNVVIGMFVLGVGVLYIKTGMSVGEKLEQLQQSLQSPEAIKHAFAAADKDGNEELDVKELMEIMALLGSTMTEKEAEACLMILDKNGNNTVSLDEFIAFMERTDGNVLF